MDSPPRRISLALFARPLTQTELFHLELKPLARNLEQPRRVRDIPARLLQDVYKRQAHDEEKRGRALVAERLVLQLQAIRLRSHAGSKSRTGGVGDRSDSESLTSSHAPASIRG